MTEHGDPYGHGDVPRGLCEALGVPTEEFISTVGLFRRVHVHHSEGEWWGSGEPLQVLIGVSGDSEAVVASPKFEWSGQELLLHAADPDPAQRNEQLDRQLNEITKKRRKAFRYCRQCRTVTAPEHRNTGSDICDSCAARNGTVF